MSDTKWAPVDGYEVCRDGSIISHKHNWRGYGSRKLKPHDNGDGYLVVRLVDNDGKRKKFRVHQIVCRAFHGPKPTESHEVRHLDGDPQNNRADNLRWGTRSENARDRVKHGKQFYPPWHKPEFKSYMRGRMKGAKERRRQL